MSKTSAVPQGYKMTELGVLPKDWDVTTFGNVFDFLSTANNSRADLSDDGEIKYIHYGDIHTQWNNFVDFSTASIPALSVTKTPTATLLKDGDLIVVDASEDYEGIAKSVEVKNIGQSKAISGLHTYLLREKAGLLVPRFRGYLQHIKAIKSEIDRVSTGLKVYGISKGNLKNIHVPVPPRREQELIVAALTDADELISEQGRLIAKKRDIKQATMQQLLTGRTRLPGFKEKWEDHQLGELGYFSKGKGIKKDEAASGYLPCIRYGEIYTHHNDFIQEFFSFISPEVARQSQRLKRGDLLFAGSGETAEEIGKCVSFLGEEEAYVGGDIVIFSPAGQNSKYLGYLMNHETVASQKAKMGQGDAVVHISASNLARISIQLPLLDEQDAIVSVLSDMDSEIAALEAERDKTKALKQGMMQELLTGKTRLI